MEALATESLPERIKTRNTIEFIYDETVHIVKDHDDIYGVFASKYLAQFYIDNCKASVQNRLGIVEWRVIRYAAEIPRYSGAVGQVS